MIIHNLEDRTRAIDMRSVCAYGSDFRADDGLGGFGVADRGGGVVGEDGDAEDVGLGGWVAGF